MIEENDKEGIINDCDEIISELDLSVEPPRVSELLEESRYYNKNELQLKYTTESTRFTASSYTSLNNTTRPLREDMAPSGRLTKP